MTFINLYNLYLLIYIQYISCATHRSGMWELALYNAAIPFRSDAQCVRVNKFVRLSHLSVSLLIYLSPSLPFKNTQNVLPSSLLGGPSPSPSPTPHFLYPLLFPFSLSLYTPLPPYFYPPILFNPPVILIKPQFDTVMGNCTFDKKSEATCAIQGKLVLSVCNTCHVSLSV